MSWGRNNRLSRIFDPASGRTNMLAGLPVPAGW